MGATNWTVNIHPEVKADVRAYSGGGNLQLDLEGMTLQKVSAETGGGNVDLTLPSDMEDFQVLAKSGGGNVTVKIGDRANGTSIVEVGSGAGNVTVTIPSDIPAHIHAASGLGKVIIDSRFEKIGDKEYQSPDFEQDESRIELTIQSGAGNVEVN
jgi:predicted membrane protein